MSGAKRKLRVIVIGGGITGLAAALRVRDAAAQRELPLELTLFERQSRVGGTIHTIQNDGFVLEAGADSFLSEKPHAIELARRLRLDRELIRTCEEFRRTYVVRRGRLVELPEGFTLLATPRFGPLLKSPLFSWLGKLRMMLEPLIPPRRAFDDETIAAFVTRRMGREVLTRVAQPLAGGIYIGDTSALSVEATMPRFVEMERTYGSLTRALRAGGRIRGTSGARWSLFLSFKRGMESLTAALTAELAEYIRYGAEVVSVQRDRLETAGWRVSLADAGVLEADAVLCAVPAHAAARIIAHESSRLSTRLSTIGYASAATVNMAFRARDFPNLPLGFGFVVPIVERRRIIAGSFSSLKFEGRAPADATLVRAFVGGALQSDMMQLDDTEIAAAVQAEFRLLFGVTADPILIHVERWRGSMPQYTLGHLARVAEIEHDAAALPCFALAGSAYRGVGIPDCIRSAEEAAEALVGQLAAAHLAWPRDVRRPRH